MPVIFTSDSEISAGFQRTFVSVDLWLGWRCRIVHHPTQEWAHGPAKQIALSPGSTLVMLYDPDRRCIGLPLPLDFNEGCSVLIESLAVLFAWLNSNYKISYCYKTEHIVLYFLRKCLGADESRRREPLQHGFDV